MCQSATVIVFFPKKNLVALKIGFRDTFLPIPEGLVVTADLCNKRLYLKYISSYHTGDLLPALQLQVDPSQVAHHARRRLDPLHSLQGGSRLITLLENLFLPNHATYSLIFLQGDPSV